MKLRLLFTLLILTPMTLLAQSVDNTEKENQENINVIANFEAGFLGVLRHNVQFGNNGTYFSYQEDGGQDVLFPITRFSVEVNKGPNAVIVLYQPLGLETQVLLAEDLIVDELVFPASTGVKMLYNFPFYRVSYLRKLRTKSETFHLEVGASLQIRNTTISFESNDGRLFRTNRNVGPVPILKLRARKDLQKGFFAEFEADGFYAPISYLNGSDNEVIGAILDASFRTGYAYNGRGNTYLNFRYLGGGAVGTSDDVDGPGDGFVENWLNFLTVTIGVNYNLTSGR